MQCRLNDQRTRERERERKRERERGENRGDFPWVFVFELPAAAKRLHGENERNFSVLSRVLHCHMGLLNNDFPRALESVTVCNLWNPTDALKDYWISTILLQWWCNTIPLQIGKTVMRSNITYCYVIRRRVVIVLSKVSSKLLPPQGVFRVGDSAQQGRERVSVEVHLLARQRSLLRQLRRHLRPHRHSTRTHEVSIYE